jgi:branched-chain amino acid transport system ATP-binding protein
MSVLLQAVDLTKQYGGLLANKNISFEVMEGSIVGVIGPNGAGKTTLFNMISRTETLTAGKILFDGMDISKHKPFQVCKLGMGRTYQIPQTMEDMTVMENIIVGALCHRKLVSEAREKAEEISGFCGLSEFNDSQASSLNVMQKKRLEIARALAGEPKLLLLDETMAGLTGQERNAAISLIKKVNESGVTILMIEHVMEVIMTVSEKVVVIVSGQKIIEGTPDEVTSHEEVINAYLGGGHNAGR